MKSCQLTQRSCKKGDLEKKKCEAAKPGHWGQREQGQWGSHLWPAFDDSSPPFSPRASQIRQPSDAYQKEK